jgi:predicted ArsR family transcriptional regulator
MDENHFMLVSLEDSKSKSISEVLGSKTCKKIINYLSEKKEASQKDLSSALSIPMNTLDYNMKKLLDSGFIQKKKNFFWSQKGKKIIMYGLSNKSIVIFSKKSPSQKMKSILPAFILTAAGTFAVWAYEKIIYAKENLSKSVLNPSANSAQALLSKGEEIASAPTASDSVNYLMTPHPTPIWTWFLAGALLMILVISIINWNKL